MRIFKSFLLVATLLLTEVSPFLAEMLLMMSGDVEPNPGPITLTSDSLSCLVDILYDARHVWQRIGVKLGMYESTLKCIKLQYSDPTDCLYYMLEEWLRQVHPPPSLEAIEDALCSHFVGCKHLVQDLKDEFCPEHRTEKHQLSQRNVNANGVIMKPKHDQQPSWQPPDSHRDWSQTQELAPATMCHSEPTLKYPTTLETPTAEQLQTMLNRLLCKTQRVVEVMDPKTFNCALLSLAAVKN